MSRSYKHSKFGGIAPVKAGTMKNYKHTCHKSARRDTKIKLILDPLSEHIYDCKWFYDPWISPNDGKYYWSGICDKEMRK
jgi:hypothetical protein